MKLGLAPLTLFRPPPLDLVTYAGEAGYDAVGFQLGLQDLPVSPLAEDAQFLKDAKELLARWGLSVMEVSNIVFEPERTFDEGRVLIDFAKQIGASIVQATVWDEERDRVVERLIALADYAKSLDLGITIEYMPYSQCRSFDEAYSLVSASERSNVHILLDTLHFSRSGGVLADLGRKEARSYSFIQLCDARAIAPAPEDLRYESVYDRLPLGEGGLELGPILERVPTDLSISLEIPCQRLKDLPPVEQAREHLRIARVFLAPFADRWELSPDPIGGRG
ncbi:MAG TPA: sugar phosphate isomerase/epimerase [Acidimicrobiales bacterium]|nr:sugar phosphate isomerase/epimerase [Acidimicrobiales bacterium]